MVFHVGFAVALSLIALAQTFAPTHACGGKSFFSGCEGSGIDPIKPERTDNQTGDKATDMKAIPRAVPASDRDPGEDKKSLRNRVLLEVDLLNEDGEQAQGLYVRAKRPFQGPCDCPYVTQTVQRDGVTFPRRCGRGSALCRVGGREPDYCYDFADTLRELFTSDELSTLQEQIRDRACRETTAGAQ